PLLLLFFCPLPLPPRSTLFPYTTLFRSELQAAVGIARLVLSGCSVLLALLAADVAPAATVGDVPDLLHVHVHHRARVVHVDVKKDRKSTRLNSSHVSISYAVFCLKKKKA